MPQLDQENKQNDAAFGSIKSLFEKGYVKKMYEICPLHPTKVIKALGLNHGRYVNKLTKPEKFTINEIIRFSILIGVDHYTVLKVIVDEAAPVVTKREELKRARQKAAPPKSASQKIAPKKAAPPKAAPQKVAAKKVSPQKIAPKKAAPQKASPKKTQSGKRAK